MVSPATIRLFTVAAQTPSTRKKNCSTSSVGAAGNSGFGQAATPVRPANEAEASR